MRAADEAMHYRLDDIDLDDFQIDLSCWECSMDFEDVPVVEIHAGEAWAVCPNCEGRKSVRLGYED